MKRLSFLILAFLILSSCSGSSSDENGATTPLIPTIQPGTAAPYLGATGANVLPLTVGGPSLCGANGVPNVPCTSVTICVPGTDQCQTITDVVVDTGSSGLRLFSSAVTIPLTQQKSPTGQSLAECVTFGIGSDWGPVVQAGVQLGGEPAVAAPIQLIQKDYLKAPSPCADADTSAETAGYNGILGVGPFTEDCGPLCVTTAAVQTYFSCPSAGSGECTPTTLSLAQQLQNPIALLPTDNNGNLIALPNVPAEGTDILTGSLILGIGTQSNNSPQGVTAFATDPSGSFIVAVNGQPYSGSAIDSGSNGVFFPTGVGVKPCTPDSHTVGFYCPDSSVNLNAVTLGANGAQAAVPFQVANATDLVKTGNQAFNNLAGTSSGGVIFGLPFFYGRAVFTGIEGTSSSLGVGPLWAY